VLSISCYHRHTACKDHIGNVGQQSHWMLQDTPDSSHTECYNIFQTAIIQDVSTYSRQQSYRMLQHIPDSNPKECYNIFQTAILKNATTYSRKQS